MAVTIQDIKTRLPEFAAQPDTLLQLVLDSATSRINTTQWGSKADDALVCLTGHLLTFVCKQGDAAPGAVISEKVDDVSTTYALPEAFKNSAMASTSYGRCYLELLALIFPARCA